MWTAILSIFCQEVVKISPCRITGILETGSTEAFSRVSDSFPHPHSAGCEQKLRPKSLGSGSTFRRIEDSIQRHAARAPRLQMSKRLLKVDHAEQAVGISVRAGSEEQLVGLAIGFAALSES